MTQMAKGPWTMNSRAARSFGIKEDLRHQLEKLEWILNSHKRQANLLNDQLVEILSKRSISQQTTIAFSSAKLQYLSQNHFRGTAYVIVLFLPGIFVSVSVPPA